MRLIKPYDSPVIAGALLSIVTVFLKVLPALIDSSSKFLPFAVGGPEIVGCGGGGGGGACIFFLPLRQRCND